jgi:cytochrome P450
VALPTVRVTPCHGLIKLVTYAANNGYDVVIVDSVSHYWSGAGGVLDLKEDAERRMRNPNSYTAWKDVTPIHQRMVDTLVAVNAHVIVTMRSKQDYILVERNGKQVPQKVGMAPVQRDGFEYEFDVMMDMDIENVGRIQKTRCPALTGAAFAKPGADMAAILREWLTGAAPSQAPAPIVQD